MGEYQPGSGYLNTIFSDPSGGLEVFTGGTPANTLLVESVCSYTPLPLAPCTITHLVCAVAVAGGAGAVVRLGLYAGANGRTIPGNLLVDAGAGIDGTVLGTQSIALATPLVWPGGVIWGAVVPQGSGAPVTTIVGTTQCWLPPAVPQGFNFGADVLAENGVSGALPAVANPINGNVAGGALRIRGL